jgi:glycosyltransferase involved in cell wall biosynthesis
MLRILIVNKYVRVTGGSDVHCLELAEGLRERGHEVTFLSTADDRNLDQRGIFVPPTVTNDTRGQVSGARAAAVAGQALWNTSAAASARELVASFRPDIVHVHKLYPQLSVAPVVVASHLGIPIIQTIHDYEFISASALDDTGSWRDRNEEQIGYRALNTLLYGVKHLVHAPRVDSWISISRSIGNLYNERGIATTVIPHFARPFTETLPSFAERAGVLFIGRLSEEKGLRHVLGLPSQLPAGPPILIAGDGPLLEEVQRATKLFPSLTYLGQLDRKAVAQQLASARIVIMPSLWQEPAGLVALEAMVAGTPLIVYDSGGLAEYVTDADAGIIVVPSATLLAEAITSLYDDRKTWEKFSANARVGVQRDHTRPVYLDRLEKVYADAIESH